MSDATAKLAAHQPALLALIKDRPASAGDDDAYLDRVRRSRGLETVRMVADWWRRYDLERLAPLTSRALTHLDRFDAAVLALGRDPSLPTGSGALAIHFLLLHVDDADPLVAAIARTEVALTNAGAGDEQTHEIAWPCDPWPVLGALLGRRPPTPGPDAAFTVTICSRLPGWLRADQTGSVRFV